MNNIVLGDACCSQCRKGLNRRPVIIELQGLDIYSEYVYQGEIRSAILLYKESKDQYLAQIFLHPYWSFRFRNHCVVLVPSTEGSKTRRGFDHIELLAEKSGFKNIFKVFEHKGLEQQALKEKSQRSKVQEEIFLTNKELIKNKKVLILDDIITSGNTILACEKLLRPHVLSVEVLTIARSPQLEGSRKGINLPFI